MRNFWFLVLAPLFLIGCERDNKKPVGENRTVLVYMVGDNNLAAYAMSDINEMEMGWDDRFAGTLLVYFNNTDGSQKLYEIHHDNDSQTITSRVVKEFTSKNDPCAPATLRAVIDDVQASYPAKGYGLVLWSHGTGWVAQGGAPMRSATPLSKLDFAQRDDIPASYSFGATYKFRNEMEMDQMAAALQGLHFDYISFDACYMGCMESIYQMRSQADYIISSVAEILVASAPYDKVVPHMFSSAKEAAVGMATEYYNYYNGMTGSSRSATISVTDCAQLPNVAAELKKIVTADPTVPFTTIQQYGRSSYTNVFYDLTDFVNQTWGTEAAVGFNAAMEKAIVYKAATQWMFNTFEVINHCGLSAYIPRASQPKTLNIFKTRYQWSRDSGLDGMIN